MLVYKFRIILDPWLQPCIEQVIFLLIGYNNNKSLFYTNIGGQADDDTV